MSTPPPAHDDAALVAHAAAVRAHAYAPYSGFAVGAALRAADGTVYGGCNVENASYPVGTCAERGALAKAISEGRRVFTALAVVTPGGAPPCGMCRQALAEFAPGLRVLLADLDGHITFATTLDVLLPHAFRPADAGHPSTT